MGIDDSNWGGSLHFNLLVYVVLTNYIIGNKIATCPAANVA